jgi:hypothetical protein
VTEPVHCVVTVHQSEVELSRRNKICALAIAGGELHLVALKAGEELVSLLVTPQ